MDFLEPIHGVAPGQVAAIWYQKWCLGSGVIDGTWTADEVPIRSWQAMKGKENPCMEDVDDDLREGLRGDERAVMAG